MKLDQEQQKYIEGFSFECLLGGFWWALFNELWLYAFAMLVPVVNIAVWAYLCVRGRAISMRNKKWLSFEQYKDRQMISLIIGIVKAAMVLISIILFIILFNFLLDTFLVILNSLGFLLDEFLSL